MTERNDRKPREAKNVDRSASESSARSQAAESAVTIERLLSDYYLEWTKAGQEFYSQACDHCGTYREKLSEAAVSFSERLEEISQSWHQALRESGNGDDTHQRSAASWLEHARRYSLALGEYQANSGQAAKDLGTQLSSTYAEADRKARQSLAAYMEHLSQLGTDEAILKD